MWVSGCGRNGMYWFIGICVDSWSGWCRYLFFEI